MPNLPIEDELEEARKFFGINQKDKRLVPYITVTLADAISFSHHYATKRELEAKISAYDLGLTFSMDTDEPADYKRGFYDAVEKYDAALNNIQSELKAQKEQENK